MIHMHGRKEFFFLPFVSDYFWDAQVAFFWFVLFFCLIGWYSTKLLPNFAFPTGNPLLPPPVPTHALYMVKASPHLTKHMLTSHT